MRLAFVPLVALTVTAFHSSIKPLPAPVRTELKTAGVWQTGCPVSLEQLRVLTVTHWGFDNRAHTGQLVVNANAAAPLSRVFKKLYELRFPIRHLLLDDAYGAASSRPKDNDISGSFECRQAVASPCSSKVRKGNGNWSMHAYGRAVDLNPTENPYVGCGMSRRRGIPVGRLGLGRELDRCDEGLHALLRDGALRQGESPERPSPRSTV
jgi:hypothetical protein